MNLKKEILCTLGPSSLNDQTIARLEELGTSLFRINLSHTKLEELAQIIQYIECRTHVPICLDTEGAQIRTGNLVKQEIQVKENSTVYAHRNHVVGDNHNFNFYPPTVFGILIPGDFVSIDFNSVLVQVIEKDGEKILMRVLNGGKIGQNKAVTVTREVSLPVLTQKDQEALKLGMKMGIRHVALSFANRGSDVDLIRSLCQKGTVVISKIECRNGVRNLREIAAESDALLIDRGDLSREVPIERIPRLQKQIIQGVKELKKKVYVATNLLESMVNSKTPTRAEVNDVYNTLLDGADGLVLAAETAIGKNPTECAGMIVRLIREFESDTALRHHKETEDSKPQFEDLQELRRPHLALELMTKDIVHEFCVSVDCNLETALIRLNKVGFGALFVVDEKNKLLGILTDREIRKAVLDRFELSTPVSQVMNRNFRWGRVEESREELINQLRKTNRRQLPVLDGEGILVDVVLIDEIYYGSQVLVRDYR